MKKLLILIYYLSNLGCTEKDDTHPPFDVKFQVSQTDETRDVTVKVSAKMAKYYKVDFGDSETKTLVDAVDGIATHTYAADGTYTITSYIYASDAVFVTDTRTVTFKLTACKADSFSETELTSAGWTKIFEDDFSGNLSKWNIWSGGAYNNEIQLYQPSNVEIVNGALKITPKKENVSGATNPGDPTPKSYEYTSARIECKTNISASPSTPKVRIVARIKLPSGYGMWPAFWCYGNDWPTNGEIDFIEARGQDPFKYYTNYFYGTTAGTNLVSNAVGTVTSETNLTECYHVYEMIWEESKLTSILNGKVVDEKTTGGHIADMFGKEQRIVFNIAIGGDYFTNFDKTKIEIGTMYVDWVKVFTSN